MIRDHIVVGICYQAQSEQLQMDAGLTLEKAKTLVRQRQAVQEQQILLKQKEDKLIDFLRRGFRPKVKYLRGIALKHLLGSHDRCSPSVLHVT